MPKEEQSIAIVEEKIRGMSAMVDGTQVTNDDEFAAVADRIKEVKTLAKYIKQEKEKFTAPAKAIIEEANTRFNPYIKECDNAAQTLEERAKKYYADKEKKIEADKLKIAARVEKGTLKAETAIKKLETLPEQQKTVRTDKSALRMSKVAVAKIVEPEKIPDEYWVIDEVKVRREALARHKAGEQGIPGVVIEEELRSASI
jgi:hypothetical protein